MTLSRQFGMSMLVMLIIVFIGTLWINVNNTRDFINLQLESHAQDTATSLGLSISPYVGEQGDLPIIDTMMNAIFDRGYYQSIQLSDLDGKVLIEKRSNRKLQGVPDWFVSLFPLSPPSSETEINNGWNIAGTMTIVSDPGIGYQQLWNNTKQSFWMITAIFIVTLVMVWLLVNIITKPLLAVVKQAKAISQRQFDTVKDIPKTPELRAFVEAINAMSNQLSKVFKQITNQAERYRLHAYSDSLTNVGNRRAFELAFDRLLTDAEHQSHGFLMLIRLNSLNHVNSEFGFEQGDAYIKSIIGSVKAQLALGSLEAEVYRLNGADFAILLDEFNETQCINLMTALSSEFTSLEKSEYALGTAHLGAAEYVFGDTRSSVIEEADSALSEASERNDHVQIASKLDLKQGNSAWRKQLEALINNDTAEFVAQPIKSKNNSIVYYEWLARFSLPDQEEFLPMGQLIPASIRLDFSQKLDRLVIKQLLSKLPNTNESVGLNISRLSLVDADFQNWFLETLPHDSAHCAKLVLEIPERAIVNTSVGLTKFIQEIKHRNIRICIEHFGAQLAGVIHLRQIRPDFLKIDGRFSRNIHNEPDNQFFVQSLVNIAHGLNIQVIAEMVETQEEADCLVELSVDNLQGYLTGAPASINPQIQE